MSQTGTACAESMEKMGSMSGAVRMVLSWSRSQMRSELAAQGTLLMLVLSLLPRVEPSLELGVHPPGLYMIFPLLLVLKSLSVHVWVLWLRMRLQLLLLSRMLMSLRAGLSPMLLLSLSVLLPSLCTVSPLMLPLGVLWSFWGTCTCSGFVVGVASPIITLEISACSCIWRLISLASVASDCLGNAAAIDEGRGSGGL